MMNHAARPPATAADDPRLGHLLGRKLAEGQPARAVLVGFPTDQGVRRNGGRPGAAAAPAEIRRHLARLTPDARAGAAFLDLLEHTRDLGDVPVSDDLEAAQERLAAAVAAELGRGAFVIVIGGGHETAYGHFLGYAQAVRGVSIFNWDAHADVRDLREGRGHSGSPFRQALLHPSGLCQGYRVAGLLPQSVAATHLAFIAEHGGSVVWREDLTTPAQVAKLYAAVKDTTLVTFDIDAVDQAFAPGVSAPAVGGMTPELWLAAAYHAGHCPAVTSCDVVETNPNYDRDGQTARLAAMTIWQILRGLAARGAAPPAHARRRRATSPVSSTPESSGS
jgi:formiminoglutamase